MVHDAQFDFYGNRLATCGADGLINIFAVAEAEPPSFVHSFAAYFLARHNGPVMKLSWAHPKYGSLLACGGYYRKVQIWKEVTAASWVMVHEYSGHEASVNTVEWAPSEFGLMLAAGSSDGCVSLVTKITEERWETQKFLAHEGGVTALSWASASSTRMPESPSSPLKQFVTGGGDQWVKLWTLTEGTFKAENLHHHTKWVRDVAWAPSLGFSRQNVASCSEDGNVSVHTLEREQWRHKEVVHLQVPAWRVSWSVAGNILAVSAGDNQARLYRESPEGSWDLVSRVGERGAVTEDQRTPEAVANSLTYLFAPTSPPQFSAPPPP